MLRPVPETERRLNHIQLIPKEHCLKATFLECLDNNPAKRPSCGELCELLVQQKRDAVYLESIQSTNSHENNSLQAASLTCRVQELTVSNDRLQQEVQRLRNEAQVFSTEAGAQQRLVSSLQNDLERLRSQTSQAYYTNVYTRV